MKQMITSSPRIKTVQKNLSKEILYKNAFFNKKILSNKKISVYIIDILPEMISCHLQLVPLKA